SWRRSGPLRNGSLCDGSTSASPGTMPLSLTQESSQSCNGLASGSVGCTETFDEIFGKIWSPEMKTLSAGHHRQACSGECPLPPTTRHTWSPIAISSRAIILEQVLREACRPIEAQTLGGRFQSGVGHQVAAHEEFRARDPKFDVELAHQPAG